MKNHKFESLLYYSDFNMHRPETKVCPECKESIMQTGINKLASTNDVCTCRKNGITYDHVVEQMWHKSCLIKHLAEHPDEQKDYRYLPKPSNNSVEAIGATAPSRKPKTQKRASASR